ncbi:MAG: SPASM domain-containing protein [Oligoflexia bacterium]|nr:SPASM domain-containing protein [Oligoflexia bacterium]
MNDTVDDIDRVFNDFNELEKKNIKVYFRSIYSTDSFKREEKIDLTPFYKLAKERGVSIYENFIQNYSYCEGDIGITINPDLSVWKCNHDLDQKDKKIGMINNCGELVTNQTHNLIIDKVNPFSDNNCLKCSYLPLCFGGCHFDYLNNGKRNCLLNRVGEEKLIEHFLPTLI